MCSRNNLAAGPANIGLQRTARRPRAAAEAGSFGPGLSKRRSQHAVWRPLFLAAVTLLWPRASFPATFVHISLGKVTRITIDATNPWMETIAAVPSHDLSYSLDQFNLPRVSISTTDELQIAAILKLLARAEFVDTQEKDGAIDLRYRLSFDGPDGPIVLYADAVGNVVRDGRVLRAKRTSRWLSGAWNVIVKRAPESYAPTR